MQPLILKYVLNFIALSNKKENFFELQLYNSKNSLKMKKYSVILRLRESYFWGDNKSFQLRSVIVKVEALCSKAAVVGWIRLNTPSKIKAEFTVTILR